MKGRLVTNGILSLLSTICIVTVTILGIALNYDIANDGIMNGIINDIADVETYRTWWGIVYLILSSIWLTSLVMGIITLSMPKSKNAKGLTIASGILAILCGAFFAGAIVSFIAARKI